MATVPIIHADATGIQLIPWVAALTFGNREYPGDEGGGAATVQIRLSLQMTKVLAIQLLRGIRSYETTTKVPIELPLDVLKALEIAPEDWHTFIGEK